MTAQAAQKTETTKNAKKEPAVKAVKNAKEGEDEGEEEGRARSTYFIVTVKQDLGGKRDATKYLQEHKLKDNEVIMKGRVAEYRPVEAFELS
jgi:hypothetical protein